MPQVIIHNSIGINYEISGTGDFVVLLHGFCEDLHIWDLLKPSLEKHYRLVLIDLPGFGKSAPLKDTPSIESYADAVHAVLQNENITECRMVGHSMGGYVTLAFAEKYPALLSAAGLFHSQSFADDDARKEARLKSKQFVQEVSSSRYVEELMGNLFLPAFKQENPGVVKEWIERYKPTEPEGIVYALDAMRTRKDRTLVLKLVRGETLLIASEKDNVIPYMKSLEMASVPARSEVVILKNSGHMGMIEEPEKSINEIINWKIT